ncbi:MAG: type II toxin-antitoxin system MqsA family antitoxin [Deltaproteobacteria bacterium]|nr:type II toxin-antitoxin system MqsA family antitoxin [Deltaproteobacteria bacterium]
MKVRSDDCPACGTRMRERRGRLELPVNGEKIAVPDASHLRCPKCGERILRFDEARHLRESALEIYRRRHALLTADEIRSMRERLGLSQASLARLLRLGGNTISRWESGRNVQSGAMDVLLRLIRDMPGSLDYLRGIMA